MVDKKIFFYFSYESAETSFALLQNLFSPVNVHCVDCLKVRRDFREGFRGYLFGQGLFPDGDGHIMGRAPITTIEREMEKSGPKYEITFSHDGAEIYGTISKGALVVDVCNVSKEWLDTFEEKIRSVFQITEWQAIDIDTSKVKRMRFHEDLAHRLEVGDFKGGENHSYYLPSDENENIR